MKTPVKKTTWAALAALCPLAASANDTLRVERAELAASFEVSLPYSTDTIDMQAKAFDLAEYLKNNKPNTLRRSAKNVWVGSGEKLTATGAGSLRVLNFTLSTPRFMEIELKVDGLKQYKLYANDKELDSGKKIQLLPGTKRFAVACLTRPEDNDTLNIRIVGKDLAGLAVNQEGKRPYTMDDMLQGDHYRSVSLSPSGKYLITSYYYTKEDGSNQWRTVLSETSSEREVMRRNEYASWSWLPERDVIYYTRQGATGRQLVTLDPETQQESVLAETLPDGGFSISPKEDYLIFSQTQEGAKEAGPLKLLVDPDDRQGGWRNRNALFRYDLKSGETRRLTFGSESVYLNDISNDGKKLLLSFSRMNPHRTPFTRTTLLSMDAFSGAVDTLLCDTAFISSARFSPDGKQVLLLASPAAFNGIGSEVKPGQIPNSFDNRLYLYDIGTRKARALQVGFKPSVNRFHWSAADGFIYLKATDGCDESLFRLDPKTGETVAFSLPVSCIQGYDIANTKQPLAVFFGQTGTRARDLYLCRLSSAAPKAKRIGEIDFDDMSRDWAIGTCHDWDFRSERGDTIHGFYFLPPGFDGSKSYPLIVYYYGGCTPTAKMLEFQYPLQVLAAQGYVVYVVQPSGAIGFGQEFAARHVNTWGQGSANDIIEGTKAFLAAHPYANPKKVGCMGASYGGFMTQYLQTQTDLFATAVSHAGISNIASYWGGGYWGYTYGEAAQYGSYPWNNPDLYVKQSPLFNADKIHTPLLLLHGTADTNVPPTESLQLFTALRILGRPVSLIQVDGENHVIVNYDKRIAWQNAIFAWFAHWLKDEPEWWKALYPNDTFGQEKQ